MNCILCGFDKDKKCRCYTAAELEPMIEELRKDKARLEWMIENEYYVCKCLDGSYGVFQQEGAHTETIITRCKDARSAVDAAMEQEKKA